MITLEQALARADTMAGCTETQEVVKVLAAEVRREAWTEITKSVPEPDEIVEVFSPGNPEMEVWPAKWNLENQCFWAGWHPTIGWFEKDEITHWRHLSLPPKEQQP